MDKNFVLTGNKLIAEFMDWELKKDIPIKYQDQTWLSFINNITGAKFHTKVCVTPEPKYNTKERTKAFESLFYEEYCEYHKSYDWLMPVVEKIETLSGLVSPKVFDNYLPHYIRYVSGDSKEDYERFYGFGFDNFDELYQKVVKFIKWYNENKDK